MDPATGPSAFADSPTSSPVTFSSLSTAAVSIPPSSVVSLWTINNVMLEDIDRIEVICGPGGTIWGTDAVNGVINIITKDSQQTKGTLLSTGGGNVDENTEDLRHGSEQNGSWTWRAEGFRIRALARVSTLMASANYDWSRDGQVGFRIDHDTRLRRIHACKATPTGEKFGDAQGLSTYAPPASFISYQSTNVSGGNLRTRWRRSFSNKSDIYLQGYWAHDHRIGSNFGENRDTFDVDFLHRLAATRHGQFTWGVGIRLSPSDVTQTIPTAIFNPREKTESNYSAFLQEELRLVPGKLSLIAGSKLEHNNYTGFEYQPNARLLITPTDKFSAWPPISRAVRIPDRVNEDIQDDIFVVGTPLIFARVHAAITTCISERLIAYEGGLRALVRSHASTSAPRGVLQRTIAI